MLYIFKGFSLIFLKRYVQIGKLESSHTTGNLISLYVFQSVGGLESHKLFLRWFSLSGGVVGEWEWRVIFSTA